LVFSKIVFVGNSQNLFVVLIRRANLFFLVHQTSYFILRAFQKFIYLTLSLVFNLRKEIIVKLEPQVQVALDLNQEFLWQDLPRRAMETIQIPLGSKEDMIQLNTKDKVK
jgi:hypothetical protein